MPGTILELPMRTSVAARVCIVASIALVFVTSPAWSQALPNINTLRVRYNTQKTSAKPEGELKAQIDQVDKEVAEATRLGRTGDVRRLFAKGLALLAGRSWTDADEFQASLVLRTSSVVVDSTEMQTVRLEQIFAPSITLSPALSAVASIRPQVAQPSGAGQTSIELARFDQVRRDLRYSPLMMDLDLSKVADGPHVLEVALKDGERALGTVTLRLALHKGLAARLRQLGTAAAAASPDVRPSVAYPGDYVRKINRGSIELGAFNVVTELSAAETIAAAAKGGKNPFVGRTGGFERHYVLDAAGEIMPYRVHVPSSYDGSRAYPLIVALHGLGGTEDSFMDQYNRTVPTLAEQRGYIVVAPLGFRVDGFYGFNLAADANAGDRRRVELSEQDVLEVLKRARSDYKIDESRIYLMGHSMGGIGTWALGAKYPSVWAAMAPFAGLGNPQTMERMKHIPQFVVHGDADPTVNVSGSRTMVAAMAKLGVDHKYIEVPGGNHTDIVVPNLAGMFDFFDTKRKASSTTQQ
jgi:poly(3-hydroxybutyrate) depolymerase